MRKLQRNTKISLAALFLVPIIISTIGLSIYGVMDEKIYLNSLYAQGEIVILNDYDFSEKYSFPGSGTAEDPFLIENYLFDDPDTTAIVIKDTTKHFIIRNCSISKLGQPLFISNIGFNTGILINNTFIEDTTLETSAKFIDVRESRERFFDYYYRPYEDGFTFILNAPGIRIENNLYSSNMNLTSNSCNGLCILSSDYSVISNNTVSFFDLGIIVFDSLYVNIVDNFSNSNSIGIKIERVKESLVMNNKCTNNTNGIEMCYYTEKVLVIANSLKYNTEVGLLSYELSISCQIRGNLIEGNRYGLCGDFQECNITYNYFSLNINYSISFDVHYSNQNFIHHNSFINNNYEGLMVGEKQAFDNLDNDNYQNFWYDDYSKEGNFWSDLVWNEDSKYHLDGGTAIDLHPLFEQPIIEPWEDLN